jgi:hypothetical protein
LQKALDESTAWGRAWAADGLKNMKQECKNELAGKKDNAWGLNVYHRLMHEAQTVKVVDLSNATIWGADWGAVTDTGVAGFTSMEYQQAQRDAGIQANAMTLGNTIILMQDRDLDWVGNSPSPLRKRMVHELMHSTYGTHEGIAQALWGTKLGGDISEMQVNQWLDRCF